MEVFRDRQRFIKQVLLLVSLSFFIIITSYSQSPGGIPTNNTLWLKADSGLTIKGTNTVWQEVSGAAATGNFIVQNMTLSGTPNQTTPSLLNPGINFNPFVRFDGKTNSLSSTNKITGNQLVGTNEVTVFQVINLRSGTVWFKWETDGAGSIGRLGFEKSSTNTIRFDYPEADGTPNGRNIGVASVLNSPTLST